jgi:hypothetical protein
VKNPYITGNIVTGPDFYGREHLIQAILYGPDVNFWIIGNRRVGKTSLLREIERRTVDSNYLSLFWDMSARQTEAEFAEKLKEAIEDAQLYGQDSRWANFTPLSTKSLRQALRHLAGWAHHQQLCLLLLCDEAEALLYLAKKAPIALQDLRDTLQNQAIIRPVLTSTRRLSRLYEQSQDWGTSLFLDGFASYPLGNFRGETATQLITQAKSTSPLEVEKALLTDIRQTTGNHPLLLQKLCSQLFNNELGNLRSLLPADIALDPQITGFFQIDFNALTPDEVELLQYVSTSPCTTTKLQKQFSKINVRLLLHNLTELGFLRKDTNNYDISNLFLAEWLKTSPTHQPKDGVTNRMLREIAQERVTSLQRQLIACYRHLGQLELRQAKQGLDTPPHIITEIEDYKKKITGIEAELAELGEQVP